MKLKNIKRKKLNNKGFTLIELLAVVVILAVVMGIAMTSVLSSMNKARRGSLQDTATSIAHGFNTKYTESLVDGVANDVYGLDFSGTSNVVYYLTTANHAKAFNISDKSYDLEGSGSVDLAGATGLSHSFVAFDANKGEFVICMFAKSGGNVFVNADKSSGIKNVSLASINVKFAANTMFACSDGTTNSWTS